MENNMKPYHHGRPMGSPNKVTNEIRKRFSDLIAGNIDRMQNDLDSLKPRDRLEMIIALSRFVIPTIRAVEIKADDARPFPAFAIQIDGQIDETETINLTDYDE